MRFIVCRGNKKNVPSLLEGWEYGSRSDCKIYSQPSFIDINWKSHSWFKHWFVVKKWIPDIAMALDYEHPSQKKALYRQIDQLIYLGVQVAVCPKFDKAEKDVPKECIVAVSVPTTYAGFIPRKINHSKIHFLGGHPDQYKWLIEFYDEEPYSVDCNVQFMKAGFGAYWLGNDWEYTKNQFATNELIRKSQNNIKAFLLSDEKYNPKKRRIKRLNDIRNSLW